LGILVVVSESAFTAEHSSLVLVLLEPDDDVRDALEVLLRGQGWLTEVAASLDALRQYLASLTVTAVVSEARLPGCEAADVLKACQQIDVPVVFTGHDIAVQDAVDLIRQGAIDYLEKPFSRQRLLNLLNRLTNRHNNSVISG